MDGFFRPPRLPQDWMMPRAPGMMDFNQQRPMMQPPPFPMMQPPPAPVQPPDFTANMNDLVQLQLQMLSKPPFPPTNLFEGSKPEQITSFGPPKPVQKPVQDKSQSDKYNPFVEDTIDEDMDISDEEKESQSVGTGRSLKGPENIFKKSFAVRNSSEVKSGAAFYQGLILYIPPFEQLAHTYRGSPALKMLYASFEFSFKLPVKIETKPRENLPNVSDATIYFKDHIIATGSGVAPHVEASVRALELLSETCYTIQAKEDYFLKCKLVDAENMKTLNLKKWEAVSEKYPKIIEVTKESHIQKTFAVFLDTHTSSGIYEDIVCCNLTRQDVNNIKSVVEFFHLTMLPCSISTNLSKKQTPCVVSIHKYTSAKKLLDILVECGGENDKFRLHPPDTFRDFYKLHPNYWDPNLRNKPGNTILENKTTLDDPTLQSIIMQPYENVISELFEKYKTLPKVEREIDDVGLRKAGDDFMKSTFQIDMAQSKNVAPVERMQLLLKYMEQLQEYGSRVLTSGRADMIKIYHNAIENVRKDLDECRKDMEKEQKDKEKAVDRKKEPSPHRGRSPPRRKVTPPRRRSKSPAKKTYGATRRSPSPRRRPRSKSPRRPERPRRSPSPRRRPRSPPRRPKSKSPVRRARSKSPRRPHRASPPRRPRSPQRSSPPRRRSPQPSRSLSKEDDVFISIFKDQFRRYVDILRRFRIEIEDTPPERRLLLKERLYTLREQLEKFKREVDENPKDLGELKYELEICLDELLLQHDMIVGRPGPSDLGPFQRPIGYPLPHPLRGAAIPPPPDLYGPSGYVPPPPY